MRNVITSVIPIFHSVAVVTLLVNSGSDWPVIVLVFLMLPFYALGARVSGNWIADKLEIDSKT